MPHTSHSVMLYGLSTCVHCRHARDFLRSNNINFQCVYVDELTGEPRTSAIDAIRKHNPRVSFPTIIVDDGEQVVVGFKKDELVKVLEL